MRIALCLIPLFVPLAFPRPASGQATSGTITVDGVPLRYVRDGHGPPVVAIASGVYYPKAYSPELRKHFDLIFVDFRHFVPSYQPTAQELASITLETFADDLEEVRRQLHIESWAVIGHSIHAQIALAYARKYPARVSQLIIIAGVPFAEYGAGADSFFSADASPERKAALSASTESLDSVLAAVRPERRFAVGYDRRAALYWANPHYDAGELLEGLETGPAFGRLFAVIPPRAQVRATFQALTVPTLIVLGRLDYAVPYYTWEPLVENLPNVSYVLLENDSHNPQTEDPGRFDSIFIRWLAEH